MGIVASVRSGEGPSEIENKITNQSRLNLK